MKGHPCFTRSRVSPELDSCYNHAQYTMKLHPLLPIFTTLNALLIHLHPDAIPRRDILASLLGCAGLVGAIVTLKENTKIHRTKRFLNQFLILSGCEVVVNILLPWLLLAKASIGGDKNASEIGFVLAPHLFVFQSQIAIESIILAQGENKRPLLMFQYTCIANLYRGVAVATMIHRTMTLMTAIKGGDSAEWEWFDSIMLVVLPVLTTLLWLRSDAFIIYDWYPCLEKM